MCNWAAKLLLAFILLLVECDVVLTVPNNDYNFSYNTTDLTQPVNLSAASLHNSVRLSTKMFSILELSSDSRLFLAGSAQNGSYAPTANLAISHLEGMWQEVRR